MKTCPSCHKAKPRSSQHFHSDSRSPDGFSSSCKSCRNERRKKKPQAFAFSLCGECGGAQDFCKCKSKAGQSKAPTPIPVLPATETDLISDAFQALKNHLGTSFSLSMDSKGQVHLQTHGNPSKHFRGKTVSDIFKLL